MTHLDMKELIVNAICRKDYAPQKIEGVENPSLMKDVEKWTDLNFRNYFNLQYKIHLKSEYNMIVKVDKLYLNKIKAYFKQNNLPENEYCKKFIDWCFVHCTRIQQEKTVFCLNVLPEYLNEYYQNNIQTLSQNTVNKSNTKSIISKLNYLADKGKSNDILTNYGILIFINYMLYCKKYDINKINEVLMKKIASMSLEDQKSLVLTTINLGPYPEKFQMLDWRDKFGMNRFAKEKWFVTKDILSGDNEYNDFLQ